MHAARYSFLRLTCCFGLLTGTVVLAGPTRETPIDTDDTAYLRRQFHWYQSLPPQRQQQLRQLNEEFHQLDSEEQTRLTKVMQNYNIWISKLPEADRRRVLDASSGEQRLNVVAELKERDWLDSLPKATREELATLDGTARYQRMRELHAEEAEQRAKWEVAKLHWADVKNNKPLLPMFTVEGRALLEVFVGNLRQQLSDAERKSLDEARLAVDEHGNYLVYAMEIVRLSDLHPLLPCKEIGPKDYNSLPLETRMFLEKNDPLFRKKKGKEEELKTINRATGRWPEFAIEITKHAQKNNLTLPKPLGDCTKDRMPDDVVLFMNKTFEPMLKKLPGGSVQLLALQKAEGKWPDYPRTLMEIAKQQKIPVPGWTLPGPPDMWDKFRVKSKPKQ